MRIRSQQGRAALYALLIAWSCVVAYPIFLMLVSSLKETREIYAAPFSLPSAPRWGNFADAWVRASFSTYFLNSALVLAASEALILLFSTMAAYPLSRYRFRGATALQLVFLAGIMLPARLGVVKLFILMRDLGLLDTLWALIAVYVAIRIPLSVFVITNFMKTVPSEIEDAARIDGCSEPGLLFRVVLPLVRPAVAIVGILSAIAIWNDFYFPFILTYSDQVKTIPVGLATFFGQFQINWGLLFAGLTISTIPLLLFYFIVSEQLVKGIAAGAVK